jgi:hypothetical protein
MSNIDISIWGIRDGFQQGGFFHSHNFSAVKEIQQDRFRSVKNAIGREGFFMTHRKDGKFIVTYCYTSIKEYNPTSKRGAYVCFSFIIDEVLTFSTSPRSVLKELAALYVKRVGDTNSNNFDAEDIQTYTRKIQTEQKRTSGSVLSGNHYMYYTAQEKIDEVLTGKLAFVNLSELVLIPNNEIDPKTNSFHDIDFYDEAFGAKPSYFNLKSEKDRHEDDELIRRQKAEQDLINKEKERILQEEELKQGKQLDSQLAILLNQNRFDEAIKLYKESPAGIKSKISQQVANDLKHRLQKRDSDDVEKRKRQEDKEKIDEINTALLNGDLDSAVLSYNKLHDKFTKDLPEEKRKQIQAHNTKKLEDEARIQKENSDKAKQEAKKKKRLKIVLFSSFLGILLLFLIGFFTTFPGFIWDADGDGYHTYLEDDCPDEKGTINGCPDSDKDGVIDKNDDCPKEKGNVNGCPDSDKDGVADKDDDCDTIPGSIENKGCPVEQKTDTIIKNSPVSKGADVAPQEESDKLLNGKAVLTPSDGNFQDQTIGHKWLRFNNKNYEFSDFENKQFNPVASKETVDLLNQYYGLKGVLKQGGTTTTPPPPQTKTKPQTNSGQTTTPPEQTTKPPKSKTKLTLDEERELNDLQVKESTTPLSRNERNRKKTLLGKKG